MNKSNGGNSSVSSFESIVDEVAIIFASGETKEAAEILIKYLNSVSGDTDKKVWFMLLDIFQAIDDHKQFDATAVHYANKFSTSPPSWEGEKKDIEVVAVDSQIPQSSNSLIVDTALTIRIEPKMKEFVVASREAKTCRLNLSNIRPDKSDIIGFRLLQEGMYILRKNKVLATLMGDTQIQRWLKEKIDSLMESQDSNDMPYWLVYLEILQWRGMAQTFEDVALNYAMIYEVSPPGWDDAGVMSIEDANDGDSQLVLGKTSDMVLLDDVITDSNFGSMESAMKAVLADKEEVTVNMANVKRFDFNAAGGLCSFLGIANIDKSKIILYHPNELVVTLFAIVGASDFFTIIPRKR